MKKYIALLLVVVLCLGLCACGTKKTEDTKAASDAKSYKFGIIYTANNNFWEKVGDGGQAKADELNKTGKYNISVYATGPQTTGAAGQIQLMEDMISQKYDGIIIAASDTSALAPTIDKAVDAGIPVVCMDTEVPDSKRLCFVGTDNVAFGKKCGETLAELCGGKGKVIVQYLDPSMLSMAQRAQGFRDAIAQYPDMEIIFEQADVGGDMGAIAANIETLAAKFKDEMTGYCMLYVGGENVCNTWRQMGWNKDNMHTVLSDDIDPIIVGIKDGTATCTVVQGQFNWGYEGVRILVEYLAEGKTPPAFVDTGCYPVDAEKAEELYPNVKVEQ